MHSHHHQMITPTSHVVASLASSLKNSLLLRHRISLLSNNHPFQLLTGKIKWGFIYIQCCAYSFGIIYSLLIENGVQGGVVRVQGDEFRHMTKVLRLSSNDRYPLWSFLLAGHLYFLYAICASGYDSCKQASSEVSHQYIESNLLLLLLCSWSF